MRIIFGMLLCACVAAAAPAHAYTREQTEACYPDARKLCGAPANWRAVDTARAAQIIACMAAQDLLGHLSRRCRAAFGR